jgi:hypothetical protein
MSAREWGATPWRVGRKVGRTVYDTNDTLIGVMDTPELAARVVAAVNARESCPFGGGSHAALIRQAKVEVLHDVDTVLHERGLYAAARIVREQIGGDA